MAIYVPLSFLAWSARFFWAADAQRASIAA
jgi:hypothetical protein